MFEWEKSVQVMIDCVEENLTEPMTLPELAKRVNYSPYYATRKFQDVTGMTLRDYIRMRKVSSAVLDLRNTNMRIIDIAVKYGFSSQEAFSRSFAHAFGLTPSTYRKMPKPLPLLIKRNTYNPYFLGLGELSIMRNLKKDVKVCIQVLPEHRFIGLRGLEADNYFDFWEVQHKKGVDCDETCGLFASIIGKEGFNGQVGGWFYQDGKRGYAYGVEVPANYDGEIPDVLESFIVPEGKYVVFHHPPYDYDKLDASVYQALWDVSDEWGPSEHGFKYDDRFVTYQRHAPENYGQAFCRRIVEK